MLFVVQAAASDFLGLRTPRDNEYDVRLCMPSHQQQNEKGGFGCFLMGPFTFYVNNRNEFLRLCS